jgi:hypothetical protein
VIAGLIDRAGGLSVTTPEAQFPPWEAERLLEEIISGVERELEKLCGRSDYRQLLFLSRLCVGVPPLRSADADMGAVRVRGQTADRWVLRCGDRSLDHDYMGLGQDGISIGKLPESIFRDVAKLHWLAQPVEDHRPPNVQLRVASLARERPAGSPVDPPFWRGRRPRRGLARELGVSQPLCPPL